MIFQWSDWDQPSMIHQTQQIAINNNRSFIIIIIIIINIIIKLVVVVVLVAVVVVVVLFSKTASFRLPLGLVGKYVYYYMYDTHIYIYNYEEWEQGCNHIPQTNENEQKNKQSKAVHL